MRNYFNMNWHEGKELAKRIEREIPGAKAEADEMFAILVFFPDDTHQIFSGPEHYEEYVEKQKAAGAIHEDSIGG